MDPVIVIGAMAGALVAAGVMFLVATTRKGSVASIAMTKRRIVLWSSAPPEALYAWVTQYCPHHLAGRAVGSAGGPRAPQTYAGTGHADGLPPRRGVTRRPRSAGGGLRAEAADLGQAVGQRAPAEHVEDRVLGVGAEPGEELGGVGRHLARSGAVGPAGPERFVADRASVDLSQRDLRGRLGEPRTSCPPLRRFDQARTHQGDEEFADQARIGAEHLGELGRTQGRRVLLRRLVRRRIRRVPRSEERRGGRGGRRR